MKVLGIVMLHFFNEKGLNYFRKTKFIQISNDYELNYNFSACRF